MLRSNWLKFFVLLCCLHAANIGFGAKPNVLLVCVDDLKPLINCYGESIAKTPNIDRFARSSMQFERAYCNQAVCSPSRNALLVGLRPQSLGIYDLPTNFRKTAPNAITMPEHFKANGYETQSLGKIFHVGHGNVDDSRSWSVPSFRARTGAYALDSNRSKNADGKGAPTESADVPDDRYDDGSTALEAIRRIEDASKKPGTPFFIAVGFIRPHLPFVAPKKYWDMHDPSAIALAAIREAPKDAPAYAPQYGGELRNYADLPKSGSIPDAMQRHLIHGYLAATSYMDAQFGLVLDALDRLSLRSNTIVVFWGDHGWHLGDHGMWCKHTTYEQATRIPLLISAPGYPTGKSQAFIESVDLYPTLCELAGIPQPDGLDGKSQVQVLSRKSDSVRDHAIQVYPRNRQGTQVLGRAIRTSRYRMVQWMPIAGDESDAEYELYDYQNDPLETINVANTQTSILKDLKAILSRHPTPKPQYTENASTDKSESTRPGQDRNLMFDRRDLDQDGKLTREEFLRNQPDPDAAPKRFTRFDANGDGVLSREEFVNSGNVVKP